GVKLGVGVLLATIGSASKSRSSIQRSRFVAALGLPTEEKLISINEAEAAGQSTWGAAAFQQAFANSCPAANPSQGVYESPGKAEPKPFQGPFCAPGKYTITSCQLVSAGTKG